MNTYETGYEGKYMRFELSGRKPRTLVWNVCSVTTSAKLGYVAWFGRWRNYAFFPDESLVFDKNCLREIADFIERKNQEHRQK